MRCKFCFATFQDVQKTILPKGHLPKEESLEVVRQLAKSGFDKITFVGGEPTLCPWLPELIAEAKKHGLTTMVVTNGSRLTPDYLERISENLDWIALSIDSANQETNLNIGRAVLGKQSIERLDYLNLTRQIKKLGIRFKVNTVVNSYNAYEDMGSFMLELNPERWKIFQALPVNGQNDQSFEDCRIEDELFNAFLERHAHLNDLLGIVAEDNDDMRGSYAMVDPAGRFFDNSKGGHSYSSPILSVGVHKAMHEVHIDTEKFFNRGGDWDWK